MRHATSRPACGAAILESITRGLAAQPEQESEMDAPPLAPDQVDHVMSFLKARTPLI
jgi:hypothetical protein